MQAIESNVNADVVSGKCLIYALTGEVKCYFKCPAIRLIGSSRNCGSPTSERRLPPPAEGVPCSIMSA